MIYLGIDISKLHIDLSFKHNQTYQHLIISNDEQGFHGLLAFIQAKQIKIDEIHACCEATNVYYLELATFLHNNQIKISVVNPSVIKSYAEYHLRRVKTDKQDSKLIADFCEHEQPEIWQPKAEHRTKLTSLYRRTNQLNQMLVAEKQRLEVADEHSKQSINRMIEWIETELKTCREQMQKIINENAELKRKQQILESITGIGRTTSQILLPIMLDLDKFSNHRKLISYLGLSPIVRQSGKSKGRECVSKMGDSVIRKSLYMPARAACTRSKLWRAWFEKQIARGKHTKQVYIMMMTKLVKYAYYCIKRNELFKPEQHV